MITVLSVTFEASAFLNAASVFKSSAEKLSSNINILGFLAIALAIDNLCFCPPETFVPPCEIGASYFPAFSSMNSEACAISAACLTSSIEALAAPYLILDSIVPEKRTPFCGTYPSSSLKSWIYFVYLHHQA